MASYLKNAMAKKCPTSIFVYPVRIVRKNSIHKNCSKSCEAHRYFSMFLLFGSLTIGLLARLNFLLGQQTNAV